jgi:pimeloyl-ACP methyl ester carboxylesterase
VCNAAGMTRLALALLCALAMTAFGRAVAAAGAETTVLGGRTVDIWRPAGNGAAPIIIFSHGFLGCGRQSSFLTQALADAGYFVIAPQHADSMCARNPSLPEVPFWQPQDWSDATYRARHDDIVAIIAVLHRDPAFAGKIDWSKLGLMGHSLGGYTVLGLAGAWPSWRIPGVKAVVALSPWCLPFLLAGGKLGDVSAPVEYQGGTGDFGITESVSLPGGCYDSTRAPAAFVEFQDAGHLAWTDLVPVDHGDMIFYARTFFDVWLRGKSAEPLRSRRAKVADLRSK